MSYSLGNVKPWVASAANDIGPKFGIRTIYGYSYRTIEGTNKLSDHALGLALDFMCDIPTGDRLAAYVQANAAHYSVTYIIHNRRIWNIARASEGWRVYTGINPHTDHVHVSFQSKPGSGNATATTAGYPYPYLPKIPKVPGLPSPPDLGKGAAGAADAAKQTFDALKAIAKVAFFLQSPAGWMRLLMFGAGLLLIVSAMRSLTSNASAGTAVKTTASAATRTAVKAVSNG